MISNNPEEFMRLLEEGGEGDENMDEEYEDSIFFQLLNLNIK